MPKKPSIDGGALAMAGAQAKAEMSAHSTVTSLVATYLSNVAFRDEIAADRGRALDNCGLSPALTREFLAFDFHALESFGGLITKTQHNYLYEDFPHTRRLLGAYGLDLTVFSGYRSEIQRHPAPGSREDKTSRFLNYLTAWLEGKDRLAPGLADVLKHEAILHKLRTEAVRTDSPAVCLSGAERRTIGPSLRPGVILAEFQRNPLRVIDLLQRNCAITTARRRCNLIYQMQAEEIITRRPSELVWKVLQSIDRHKSFEMLCGLLDPIPGTAVRDVLSLLEASGLISIEFHDETYLRRQPPPRNP